ncbi:MAG: peroxide stress protein YaaA, partial [Flavobacteriales bacterium]
MGTSLSMGRGRKDLYAFWGDRITDNLNAALRKSGSDVLIDLASTEYFKSVQHERLDGHIITPVFKEDRPGGPKMLMAYAKHQRGAMTRWIIQHRLLEPEMIKQYEGDGYRFDAASSSPDQWVFLR